LFYGISIDDFLAGLAEIPPKAPMAPATNAALLGKHMAENLAIPLFSLLATATLTIARWWHLGLISDQCVVTRHINHLRVGLG
jgi:hypothetical protein